MTSVRALGGLARILGLSAGAASSIPAIGWANPVAAKPKVLAVQNLHTGEKIEAWIDGAMIVDFAHPGQPLSIRVEVWESQPFGIATWQTTGRVRNLTLRPLPATGIME